jgi:hypothetical protein
MMRLSERWSIAEEQTLFLELWRAKVFRILPMILSTALIQPSSPTYHPLIFRFSFDLSDWVAIFM